MGSDWVISQTLIWYGHRRTSTSCVQWSSTFRRKWWRRRPMRHVPHAYWKSVPEPSIEGSGQC